jgi:hypothetical protein
LVMDTVEMACCLSGASKLNSLWADMLLGCWLVSCLDKHCRQGRCTTFSKSPQYVCAGYCEPSSCALHCTALATGRRCAMPVLGSFREDLLSSQTESCADVSGGRCESEQAAQMFACSGFTI